MIFDIVCVVYGMFCAMGNIGTAMLVLVGLEQDIGACVALG